MRVIVTLLFLLIGMQLNAQTIMNIYQSGEPVLQIPINQVDSITYSAVGDPGSLAIVTTYPMGAFSATTATLSGEIDLNGGTAVTDRGIVCTLNPDDFSQTQIVDITSH